MIEATVSYIFRYFPQLSLVVLSSGYPLFCPLWISKFKSNCNRHLLLSYYLLYCPFCFFIFSNPLQLYILHGVKYIKKNNTNFRLVTWRNKCLFTFRYKQKPWPIYHHLLIHEFFFPIDWYSILNNTEMVDEIKLTKFMDQVSKSIFSWNGLWNSIL